MDEKNKTGKLKPYVKYPKDVVQSELFSALELKRLNNKEQVKDNEDNEDIKLSVDTSITKDVLSELEIKEVKKSLFSVAGAYPYIYDALCYICTHADDLKKKYGKEQMVYHAGDSSYYTTTLPYDDFVNLAIGNEQDQRKYLNDELYKIATRQGKDVKYIPTEKGIELAAPIIVVLKQENKEKLGDSELRKLANTSRKTDEGEIAYNLPKIEIEVLFLRSLFKTLFTQKEGKGKAWFPLPSTFQAKIVKTLRESLQENTNLSLTSQHLRRYFLYLNLHDNSQKDITCLNLNQKDLWLHVFDNKEREVYIRDRQQASGYIELMNYIFCDMAAKGRMRGAKIFPKQTVEIYGDWYRVAVSRKPQLDGVDMKRIQEIAERQNKKRKFLA